MGTTIGIKTWLASIFPTMIPSVAKEKTLTEQLAEIDERIEKNRIRIRDAVLRMVSEGRVAEVLLYVSYPRSDELAYTVMESYRRILMEEHHITENDLIPVEEAMRMMKAGEL